VSDSCEPRPVLYLVSNCHLDTQWRWTVRDTIGRYLPATTDRTFELFERLPAFVLSFEGAFRYQLLEEYWPERFEPGRKPEHRLLANPPRRYGFLAAMDETS